MCCSGVTRAAWPGRCASSGVGDFLHETSALSAASTNTRTVTTAAFVFITLVLSFLPPAREGEACSAEFRLSNSAVPASRKAAKFPKAGNSALTPAQGNPHGYSTGGRNPTSYGCCAQLSELMVGWSQMHDSAAEAATTTPPATPAAGTEVAPTVGA